MPEPSLPKVLQLSPPHGLMAERSNSLDQTIRWLVAGEADGDIVEALQIYFPDDGPPAAILEKAVDEIDKAGSVDRRLIRGWCLLARRELYRLMLADGDYVGALKATERIEALADKMR